MKKLIIGSLIFPNMDQLDFTGPFEVLSRIPGASMHVLWKTPSAVTDIMGLTLTPTTTLKECPRLDVLHVPGGLGQEQLMEDAEVLEFIKDQARNAQFVFSVCTGALICGAAGLLIGRKATTHWASFDLLPFFGATPVRARTVHDGKIVTTAGVTAGIDAALQLAAMLQGESVAQQIQLALEYDPEAPFDSGSPEKAPFEVLDAVRKSYEQTQLSRRKTAEKIARNLGVIEKQK